MSQSGFMLIAHWPRKEREGDALFVKQAFFYNSKIGEYLKKNKITDEHSKIYYEPFFKSYYYLEDNTDDSLKSILKEGLPYEGEIGLIIDDLTETGSLALDVGSHIGIHTITMSRKTGPQGAVIAFEPDKKYYMELLETLSLNECTNVLPICKALGDTCKSAFFQKYMIQEEAVGVGDWVETLSLDSLHLNNVSLIKMDIENYEYFALKGAQETLLRNKPVIIFECWIGKDYAKSDPKERANFDRVISLLESYDYEIFVIYSNDFIAFPRHGKSKLESYKNRFRKLDLNNFDLGLIQ
jgi:FkbM family methyltransferase